MADLAAPVDRPPATQQLVWRVPRAWLLAAVPAVLYLVVRGVGIGVYALLVAANHWNFDLHTWDGDWYLQIAQHGYLGVDPSMNPIGPRTPWTPMVFFPGYPLAVKVVSVLCAGNFVVAGVAVSFVAGVVASYGVARLARNVSNSRRTEIISMVLFAAAPMSITYALTYPEALLCALSVWALVGIVEHRWWLAGPCVIAAGYVSPMAAPLIIVATAAAFRDSMRDRGGWWAPIAGTTASFGMVGYLLWVYVTTGGRASYFSIQRDSYGSHVDFGYSSVKWLWQAVAKDTTTFTTLTALLTVAVVVLTVLLIRFHFPWQVWVYTALTLALALGSAGIQWDKTRLLLSAFPVVLVLATVIAGQRKAAMVGWVTAIALFGLWFSAYSLAVWHYSI
ncbi:MAG TPA: hypothetical protein VHF06_21490 [Pseudonocardiaceae bacterium]|jgi:hypothetical protein|nr:hypothetical protein [Pseudonocardiaceae bacterium]